MVQQRVCENCGETEDYEYPYDAGKYWRVLFKFGKVG